MKKIGNVSLIALVMLIVLLCPACANTLAAPTSLQPALDTELAPNTERSESDNFTDITNNDVVAVDDHANSDNASVSIPEKKLEVYLLVQNNCRYCLDASRFLHEMERKYPIQVIELDVNGSDHMRCIELCKEYGVSPRGVPVLFLCKYWLVGWGKFAEEWVRSWVEECSADMAVDVEVSGDVNVDIEMEESGTLSVKAEDLSNVNIKAGDNVKVITTADTK